MKKPFSFYTERLDFFPEKKLFCQSCFAAQANLSAAVNINDLDSDIIALFTDIGDIVHAVICHFGNVEKSILSGKDFHESTEIFDSFDEAAIDFTDFSFSGEEFDFALDFIQNSFVLREDADGTVILNTPCRRLSSALTKSLETLTPAGKPSKMQTSREP